MERLVRSYMVTPNDASEESTSIISSIVQSMHSGQVSLLVFVKFLEESLTSEDPSIRAKGTGLLSAVLKECPQEQVNVAAANVLVDFYCERLSDVASIPELIRGLSLFEVTFCYFPITFKPPPDDPYRITADDLKIALRECLSATPLFAKNVMPLLLEKLTSTSGNARRDSIETLTACAPVYGVDAIFPFIDELWEYLRDEILNAPDNAIELIALEAIRSIVVTLSVGVIGRSDRLEQFLKTIVSECMENLKTPELKLSKPSGKILKYCAMASDPSFNLIVLTTMHGLLDQYRNCDLTTRKKGILEVLMEYIDAARHLYGSIEDPQDDQVPYKDDLLGIFGPALLEVNEYSELRLCGLRGLYDMILLNDFLSDNEIGIILQYFNKIVLNDSDQDIVKKTISSLENAARYKTKIVLEVTLPTLVSQLPSNVEELNLFNIHGAKYINALKALSEVPIEPVLFEALVPEVLLKLDGPDSRQSQKNLTLLFSSSVCYIRPEVSYPVPDISEFLSKVMTTSLLSTNEEQQHSLAQLAASIMNKWSQERELETFVRNNILGELTSQLSSESHRNVTLYHYLWLTKALVLRTHPLGHDCTNQIMNLFEDSILGRKASEGFGVIIGNSDILSKQSFSIIK
ncbi:9825_t:CDS:10, partial [Acaulospora colombiana]